MNIAQVRMRMGKPADAVGPLERALGIYELRLGRDHADTKSAVRLLGEARAAAGQLH
jgi:hypothetical protein